MDLWLHATSLYRSMGFGDSDIEKTTENEPDEIRWKRSASVAKKEGAVKKLP